MSLPATITISHLHQSIRLLALTGVDIIIISIISRTGTQATCASDGMEDETSGERRHETASSGSCHMY